MDGQKVIVKAPGGGTGTRSRRGTEVGIPSRAQQRPNPPQRNQYPAQRNPNAYSFHECRFLNGLMVDSGRPRRSAIPRASGEYLPARSAALFLKN
jgi:hypothetical protein